MEINADFSRRAVVHAASLPWVASPMEGVKRRMLDRVGDEVARATTIVRYERGSHFSPHTHTGGEEFLVLEGVFQDEHGDFPAGTYVRNPPTSRHTPGSASGCVLPVKLWQFDPADRTQIRINTNEATYSDAPERPGVKSLPLFRDEREQVRLEQWAPATSIDLDVPGGVEVFVLEGDFAQDTELFNQLSWLRLPCGSTLRIKTGRSGCRVWLKEGHLRNTQTMPPSGRK